MKEGGDLQEWEWLQTAFSFMREAKGSGVVYVSALLRLFCLLPPSAQCCQNISKLSCMCTMQFLCHDARFAENSLQSCPFHKTIWHSPGMNRLCVKNPSQVY